MLTWLRGITSGLLGQSAPDEPAETPATFQARPVIPQASYSQRMVLAGAIADQIWREQELVSTRMRWNFSFQAFLAAIFVYIGENAVTLPQFFIQAVICCAALAVTRLSRASVLAAQAQSRRLRGHWASEFTLAPTDGNNGLDPLDCSVFTGAYVQPFSPRGDSSRGRGISIGVLTVLTVLWSALLASVPIQYAFPGKCQLEQYLDTRVYNIGLGYTCLARAKYLRDFEENYGNPTEKK